MQGVRLPAKPDSIEDANLTLSAGSFEVSVTLDGGAIAAAHYEGLPVLQAVRHPADPRFGKVASFPLLPFGNRLEGNRFQLAGRTYRLAPNTHIDPLYLHGDGWLGRWQVVEAARQHAVLAFRFAGAGSPYAYRAIQTFRLSPQALTIDLEIENEASVALPYGLGHHFFLPLSPQTHLTAPAKSCWSERLGHLPDRLGPRPDFLDFDAFRSVPRRWVNTGFEGWNSAAAVFWPGRSLALAIDADSLFDRYFLYVPGETPSYFCFEPMSHTANGHHQQDLGGLRLLEPGERLAGRLRLTVEQATEPRLPVPTERLREP